MKICKTISMLILLALSLSNIDAQQSDNPTTFCNPLNLSYRFMSDAVDAREAADPVIVLFKDNYYLFASRSGGYWTSPDLRTWTFIVPTGMNSIIEVYAPGIIEMRDSLFYVGSNFTQIYKTADPIAGVWEKSKYTVKNYGDPALFLDDDGKLYMYYGLSNAAPTSVVELDPMTFKEIGSSVNIVTANAANHGWERRGDDNLLDEKPWIEGSWMVKHNNKYHLHYAGPGTEFKTYADGIYVADSPKGPFTYADYSPFAFKPTGFICGAGHGCTFKAKDGNYWRIGTMTISVKHMFERRLGLFPVAFDADGNIHCNTEFGDWPQYLPGEIQDQAENNFAGLLLLSHKKYAEASTLLGEHTIDQAIDEEARTYWSAKSGNPGEWYMVDLGVTCTVKAIQVNFAEEGTTPSLVRGRTNPIYEQYKIEVSNDKENWNLIIDKSGNTADVPHDYFELAQSVDARYVRIINVFTPGEGKFALREFRVFGNTAIETEFWNVTDFTVQRDEDGRNALIKWQTGNADGCIVRYGIAADKLYNNYMVYDADSIWIHSLNKGVEYFFEVEAFESGTEYYYGEYSDVKDQNEKPLPEEYKLNQNYPNPFNPSTVISYQIPLESKVTLKIYDVLGREITTLVDEIQRPGSYNSTFSILNSSLSSGIYFCELSTESIRLHRKMAFVK
ncbi:MAG: family 43 glycosylhydrolase [bacterium]